MKTNYTYDYIYLYFWYQIFTKVTYEEFSKTRNEFRKEGLGHTYTIDLASTLLKDDILEYFTAKYIISSWKRKKEKEFVTIIEKFKNDYPNSLFSEYLEPVKKEILE